MYNDNKAVIEQGTGCATSHLPQEACLTESPNVALRQDGIYSIHLPPPLHDNNDDTNPQYPQCHQLSLHDVSTNEYHPYQHDEVLPLKIPGLKECTGAASPRYASDTDSLAYAVAGAEWTLGGEPTKHLPPSSDCAPLQLEHAATGDIPESMRACNDDLIPCASIIVASQSSSTVTTSAAQLAGDATSQNAQIYNNDPSATVTFSPSHSRNTESASSAGPHLASAGRNAVINRGDLEQVVGHRSLLNGWQPRFIKMIQKKVRLRPQHYQHDNYPETAAMLILSESPSAPRLAFCGIRSDANPSGRCHLHQWCPFCCWQVRTKAQITYVPSFHEGTWHFLTGSFSGQLPYGGADSADTLHYWDAYKAGLSELVHDGLIDGAYWTEELAVNTFLPCRVLPHIHALIDAHELPAITIQLLNEKVAQHLEANLGPDFLHPDIKTSPIADEKACLDRIGYLHKTIRIFRPYEKAWAAASLHDRTWAQELNSQLTDFVKGHAVVTRGRRKINGKGTLNPRDKRFIGVRVKDHQKKAHRDLINQLKKQKTEFIEVNPQEEC